MQNTLTVVAEVRADRAPAERILTTRLVPYGETTHNVMDPHGERFMPGSLTRTLDQWARSTRPLKLFRAHEHREAVGLAVGYVPDAPGGPVAEFRVATTASGDQVLQEVEQGLLDSMSIGFRPIRERKGSDGVREVLEAALLEASILPLGAYQGAELLSVRAPAEPVDLSRYQLGPAPAVDLDSPLWSGLR